MEKHEGKGPVKIICPGKVYRRDNDDATHSHQFMQIEGLVIDENIRMSDLKGTLKYLRKKCLVKIVKSVYVQASSHSQSHLLKWIFLVKFAVEKAVAFVKRTGWIEILEQGWFIRTCLKWLDSIRRNIQDLHSESGLERIAMLKYGVDDIRHFYTNDVRFLKQFSNHEALN